MTRDPRSSKDDPTAEWTSDSSTPSASGLTAGKEGPGVERNKSADDDDVVRRSGEERDNTPRRYDQRVEDDPVMPSDDSTLNTKI